MVLVNQALEDNVQRFIGSPVTPSIVSSGCNSSITCTGFVPSAFLSVRLQGAANQWQLRRPSIEVVDAYVVANNNRYDITLTVQDGGKRRVFEYTTHRYEEPSDGLQSLIRQVEQSFLEKSTNAQQDRR
jgi:hypothetical protein